MKMIKRILLVLLVVAAGIWAVRWATGDHSSDAAHPGQLWTCGMHPQVVRNKPGDCPICGMKLTPVRKQPAAKSAGPTDENHDAPSGRKVKYYKSTMMLGEISQTLRKDSMGMDMVPVYEGEDDGNVITIDPTFVQNMGLRTGAVTKGALRRVLRTMGVIDFDETTLAEVTTKFKGWIETLQVDSTGKQVHAGDPLFEIYSPDLYNAQNEYLQTLHNGDPNLKQSALLKLKYFDVPDVEIAQLEKRGTPSKTLRINAPRDGIVVEKMAVQGQMVDAGMKLFRLADLSTVWVQAQVYEQDLAFIQLGQEATMSLSYLPDRKFRGRVTYVYPTVDERTRTARVRMEFHNPGFFLKPGMFATVQIEAQLGEAVLLPDVAVLRSGDTNTVFVALEAGHFEPRVVTLGVRGEGNVYEVLSGVKEGERVVTSAQFMLDSESQLREAIQKMLKPDATPATASSAEQNAHAGHESKTSSSPLPISAEATSYICPMPEHVSIKYEHAGKCPLCGMTLVPTAATTLGKIQPGGKIAYYTCAMTDSCPVPGHGNVKYDKPGKCPVCGMTLIPIMEVPQPKLYTCPMAIHADVVSEQPGTCPKCGMKLVEADTVAHGKTAKETWLKQHPTTNPATGAPPAHQH